MTWSDTDLSLIINDNGDGFQFSDTQLRNHYGLKFMRERIEALNGIFEVQSSKDGTEIKISVPCEKKIVMLDTLDLNIGK